MRAWRATSGRRCDQAPDRKLQFQVEAQGEGEATAGASTTAALGLPLRLHLAMRRRWRAATAHGFHRPLKIEPEGHTIWTRRN
jgi:hypothetical protein